MDCEPFTLSIDDADSPSGGCTTHLAFLLLTEYTGKIMLLDYPMLVRLAPGIPWKTRGNGAVVIRGCALTATPSDIFEEAYRLSTEYSEGRMGEAGKSPGVALFHGYDAYKRSRLRRLYLAASGSLVDLGVVYGIARREGVEVKGGRGIVGAVSSLAGLAPWEPYTFELIAYRHPDRWGSKRQVINDPMFESRLPPCVYNNFDLSSGMLVAAPRGPDPVLAGFRGSCPGWLGCYRMVLAEEPAGWVLYRTNQHCDACYRAYPVLTGGLTPYSSTTIKATIRSNPVVLPKKHTITTLKGPGGSEVEAAFYRETGSLQYAARELRRGDTLRIHATVRPYGFKTDITLAVEKMEVLTVSQHYKHVNPRCPVCGARMDSLGMGKGYRCSRCGYTDPHAGKIKVWLPRRLMPGSYSPPPGSVRHAVHPSWAPEPVGGLDLPLWIRPGETVSPSPSPPSMACTSCWEC